MLQQFSVQYSYLEMGSALQTSSRITKFYGPKSIIIQLYSVPGGNNILKTINKKTRLLIVQGERVNGERGKGEREKGETVGKL